MFAGSCAFNFALKKYTHMLNVNYDSIFVNYNVSELSIQNFIKFIRDSIKILLYFSTSF